MNWGYLLYLCVFCALVVAVQRGIRGVVSMLYIQIAKNMHDLEKRYENDPDKIDSIKKESTPFLLIPDKRESLGFITGLISYFEFILILLWSTRMAFDDTLGLISGVQYVAATISAWLAIKVIGSYQQWSGPIWGRATFYVFLIGSLLNMLAAASIPFLLIILYRADLLP